MYHIIIQRPSPPPYLNCLSGKSLSPISTPLMMLMSLSLRISPQNLHGYHLVSFQTKSIFLFFFLKFLLHRLIYSSFLLMLHVISIKGFNEYPTIVTIPRVCFSPPFSLRNLHYYPLNHSNFRSLCSVNADSNVSKDNFIISIFNLI